MNKAKRLRLIVLFGVFILFFGVFFSILKQLSVPEAQVLDLPEQESIQNRVRMKARPLRIEKKQTLVFDFEMEAFQDPEILALDPREICHLELGEDAVIDPAVFKQTAETEYMKRGELVFQLEQPLVENVVLVVFDLEQRTFEWNFSKIIEQR